MRGLHDIGRNLACLAVSATASTLLAAFPRIEASDVSLTQDDDNLVTVGYALRDAHAVVTVDFLTNGVSVGEANFTDAVGDVNRIVLKGEGKRILWRPDRSLLSGRVRGLPFTAKVTAWPLSSPPDYMVVDLGACRATKRENVGFYVSTNALPHGGLGNLAVYADRCMVFRKVSPAGRVFTVGCPSQLEYDLGGYAQRVTPYLASLSRDYYLGVYEWTQGQFRWTEYTVDAAKPYVAAHRYNSTGIGYADFRGATKGLNWPNDTPDAKAEDVDDTSIIGKLRAKTGLTTLDLPTEAEWVYAARAGSPHNFAELPGFGPYDTIADADYRDAAKRFVDSYCWHAKICTDWPDVGGKEPNAFGFYDMAGSAYELVLNRFAQGSARLPDGTFVVDPRGPKTGTSAWVIGGYWGGGPNDNRVWCASPFDRTGRSTVCGARFRCSGDVSCLVDGD